jgi:hypothetical protein
VLPCGTGGDDGEKACAGLQLAHFPHSRDAAAEVGTVQAPDAETAIQVAIEKYNIADPEKQKRLVAQRLR